ncbi:hypothetical protein BCR44DRAFT_1256221 [Catenaria anguillulae PL171]|uniref:Autophagy-related protein 9 n=1 Tax=Catenaria anguillulae PL171 TaxID=765915 RepID=A0A1Y2HDM4_9FUNG|nr:hypothetical protein BCR44DRAFT_1256221 [Catenaria anguillulae PL171]
MPMGWVLGLTRQEPWRRARRAHARARQVHACLSAAVGSLGVSSDRTRQEVAGMVVPRAMVYVNEVVGMLVAPLVLGVAVRSRADEIVSFVMDRTVVVPGLGCVYAGALFDGRYADAGQTPRR